MSPQPAKLKEGRHSCRPKPTKNEISVETRFIASNAGNGNFHNSKRMHRRRWATRVSPLLVTNKHYEYAINKAAQGGATLLSPNSRKGNYHNNKRMHPRHWATILVTNKHNQYAINKAAQGEATLLSPSSQQKNEISVETRFIASNAGKGNFYNDK